MNATYPLSIYYDSSCPLCNQEMIRLKILDQENNLNLIDCSGSNFIAPESAPSKDKMMQLMHVQTADGLWVIGVPAFRLIYAGVGFKFVADWLDRPYIKRLMTHAYPLIAKNRHRIPGWFAEVWVNWLAKQAQRRSQSCANGQCKI